MKNISVVALRHPSVPELYLHGLRRDNNKWAIVGGHANEGEDALSAAIREAYEESGLHLDPQQLELARNGKFETPKGQINVSLFISDCPDDEQITNKNDPDGEFERFQFLNPLSSHAWHVPHDRNLLVQFLNEGGELDKKEYSYKDVVASMKRAGNSAPEDAKFGSFHGPSTSYRLMNVPVKKLHAAAGDNKEFPHQVMHAEAPPQLGPKGIEDGDEMWARIFAKKYPKGSTAEPIVAHPTERGTYEILDGRHRTRAAYLRGEQHVRAWVPTNKKPLMRSEDLGKAGMRRRNPFNPNSIDDQHRKPVDNWVEHGDYMDSKHWRDKIPRLEGPARARALHRLHGSTQVRRNESGEREFLLHRGMGENELKNTHKGFDISHDHYSSWSPDHDIADSSAESRHLPDENPHHVVSAWVKESDIHHIPKAIGSKAPGDERNEVSEQFGKQNRHSEYEVIVAAGHKSAVKAAIPFSKKPWPPSALKPNTLDQKINSRISTIPSRSKGKLK